MAPMAQTPEDRSSPGRMGFIPVKVGHPRWNVLMVLVLIAVILAIALVEAQRLAIGS
jgi:hypothetical protein